MSSNEISIEKIILILQRRIWLITSLFTAAVLIAAVFTFQTPKMFSATASINFDFSASNPLDDRDGSLTQDNYITTQVGILESLNVAQKVVEGLTDYERTRLISALDARFSIIEKLYYGLKNRIKSLFSDDDRKDHDNNETNQAGIRETLRLSNSYDWLAQSIGPAGLEVRTEFDSRIVEIIYFSTDPRISALMADRYAEAYIATNLEMAIDPARKSKEWFDDQLKTLRNQLEDAQARLTAYQQQEGIVSSDERIDIETSNLRSLADQLATAQETTRNAESTKQKLIEVVARGDSLLTFDPMFNNSVIQRIRTDIRDLEGELVESSNSLGSNHPRIKKLRSELAAARQRLNSEVKTITDGIENAADLSKGRERNLEEALEQQKKLVLKLKNEHDKISVLQREVESANTTYNAALNQLNTSNMQSMVDQTSVSVVDHATIPSRHTTPRLTKNLAIGAFGGLLLGIGIALFMEAFVRKIHSKDDLINELGIPLLGHLKKA